MRTLNLSYNQLQHLHQAGVMCRNSPFDVSNNNLSTLLDWAPESFPHLLRLYAVHNAIPALEVHVCDELSKLMFLDLTYNALRDVSSLNVANCSNLRVLRLGGNLIGQLPARVLNNMHMLQQLSLFSMGLDDNVWDRISVLTYLDELELQDNSLITIPPGVMQEFTNLQYLNLSSNRIRILPKKVFIWQYKLTSLDLSSNGMTELPRQAFSSNLHSLQVLNLANNSLSYIEQTTFSGLRALKWLNCSHNHLKSVPDEAFSGLSQLQVLDFSRNQVRSLSVEAFGHVTAQCQCDQSSG
ncbi:hypothetical protein C0Q70_14571 [Pomacea canaliculata]|uniref:LRRCT domain-containing protein n=1 Tax=Pomacea canaliculata TaxID=400727 RepID=A0A2T7NSF2_POMCA|nr:leucine-rich repeat-containing protein 15-like [Pomacea canaliculata]PVD24101.1 hypothetical protein C0Q70_14571 [Pomacea canaliculata]